MDILIDNLTQHQHNNCIAFNQAIGFSSPNQLGRRAALCLFLRGVFMSAIPCNAFSMGSKGVGGFMPAGSNCQSANPFLLFPSFMFSSLKWGFKNQLEKVFIMAKIRQAFTCPFISQKIRSFNQLSDASKYVARLMVVHGSGVRFGIIQQGSRWAVCRVMGCVK